MKAAANGRHEAGVPQLRLSVRQRVLRRPVRRRSAPQPERVAPCGSTATVDPVKPSPDGKPAHAQAQDGRQRRPAADKLRKRLFEIAASSRASTRTRCGRPLVQSETGKSMDDLTVAELGPLVEAAANKLRPDAADPGRLVRSRSTGSLESSGVVSQWRLPRSHHYWTEGTEEATMLTTTTATYTPWGPGHGTSRSWQRASWRVTTPGHGGLKSSARSGGRSFPPPSATRCSTPTFAEEDCEESIVQDCCWAAGDDRRPGDGAHGRGILRPSYAPGSPLHPEGLPARPSPARGCFYLGRPGVGTPSSGSTPASRPSPSPTTRRW